MATRARFSRRAFCADMYNSQCRYTQAAAGRQVFVTAPAASADGNSASSSSRRSDSARSRRAASAATVVFVEVAAAAWAGRSPAPAGESARCRGDIRAARCLASYSGWPWKKTNRLFRCFTNDVDAGLGRPRQHAIAARQQRVLRHLVPPRMRHLHARRSGRPSAGDAETRAHSKTPKRLSPSGRRRCRRCGECLRARPGRTRIGRVACGARPTPGRVSGSPSTARPRGPAARGSVPVTMRPSRWLSHRSLRSE